MIFYAGFLIVLVLSEYGKSLKNYDHDPGKVHFSSNGNKSRTFLLFTDVHLDLMYKKTGDKSGFCRNKNARSPPADFGRIGCDTPLNLLQSALSAMKQKTRNPEFILMPGDATPHHFTKKDRRKQLLKILQKLSSEVQSVFPDIPYFPVIGNNDIPDDYIMPGVNDTWYSDVLNIWQDSILCTNCTRSYPTTSLDELRKTFVYGGYYKVSIADGKMTLLVLNTLYWTRSTWKPKDFFVNRANAQLKWLEEQLSLARKRKKKVIISSHISLGMDIYAYTSTWMSNFTDQYINLVVNKFNHVTAGQIFSHFHRDSFRLLSLSDKKKDSLHQKFSYILLIPSISPLYRNYPAFRVLHLDPSLQAITDYEQYYLNISKQDSKNLVWQLDYKFSSRYPASGNYDKVINGKRMKHLSDNLINQTDGSFFNSFISSRQVRCEPDSYSRSLFYCAITCIRKKEFDACRKKYPEEQMNS